MHRNQPCAHALVWMTLCLAAPARAREAGEPPVQDPDEFETLELRVISARPGAAVVDHGRIDGLAVGDRVTFQPRDGASFDGTVTRLQERSAEVELLDPSLSVEAGMRASVRLPKSRFDQAPAPPEEEPEAGESPPRRPRRRFRNRDEDYKPGDPLLSKVRPLRPEERPTTFHARLYVIADEVHSTEDDRSAGYYRAGAAVEYDNLFGHGDQFHVDGEINQRDSDVPDNGDVHKTRARLDRLSYTLGGTRFTDSRFEIGRFLQHGLPEFGVLDGAELDTRLPGGNSYGVSLGFMPEPDAEASTGSDFQIAAYYRWIYDESEYLSAQAGFQKSFHDGSTDRDLLVFKTAYLPADAWTFQATAWVDFYTGGDQAKGEGLELTQLYANANRRWDNGSSLSLVATHIAFPEIDRNEFTPVLFDQLADDHAERLALIGRKSWSRDALIKGRLGAWSDEDESGGDAEFGYEVEELLLRRSLLDLSGFGTWGRFSSGLGGRAALWLYTDLGRWGAEYEFDFHRLDGFSADNDDIPQHRLRGSADFHTASGWSLSVHGQAEVWDDEHAITAGFYLQKSF